MKRLILLIALLLAMPAAAVDVAPAAERLNGECNRYTMCNAQTATGVCTSSPASGTQNVLRLATRSHLTFYSDRGVGAYSCDVYSNSQGYTAASASAGSEQKVNSVSLTTAAEILSLSGLFDRLWVECTATGTQATVWLYACPASR